MKIIAIIFTLLFFSCQTADIEEEFLGINQRIDVVEYQIAFEWYDRMMTHCLTQGALCKVKKMKKNCHAKQVLCVRAVHHRWKQIKKKRGW